MILIIVDSERAECAEYNGGQQKRNY